MGIGPFPDSPLLESIHKPLPQNPRFGFAHFRSVPNFEPSTLPGGVHETVIPPKGARPAMNRFAQLCSTLVLASALALGLTRVGDTDAWTHLALGREIVTRIGFPANELFTYASEGAPYHNLEWLFEVFLYLAYGAGGYAGVVLLKATLIALVALVLWKDAGLPDLRCTSPLSEAVLRAAIFLPTLFLVIRYRIVERPDLVLMLFISFTIYALNAYLYDGRRLLYALPVVQILWANMHPSLAVSFVPYLAFLGGGAALRLVSRAQGYEVAGAPTQQQLVTVAWVTFGVAVASLANPYGLEPITGPLTVFGSWWHTAHILELQPVEPLLAPAPYLLAALLAASFVLARRHAILIPALTAAPFVFLGLSRLRFIALLGVVAAPILARNIRFFVADLRVAWARQAVAVVAATLVLGGLTATSLATFTTVEPFAYAHKMPGFGTNTLFLPEQALAYLDRKGVTGRLFNPFGWGGYIAWRDFPRRQPIIDGRGNAPEELLAEIDFAPGHPELLERLQNRYGFEVALLRYPFVGAAAPASRQWLDSERWALVYWDDVAMVYVRRSPQMAGLIAEDEYRAISPAFGVAALREALADPQQRPRLLAEALRNVRETGSALGHTFLGFAYLEAGQLDRAIEAFSRVYGYSSVRDAQQGLAMAFWKKGDLERAIAIYRDLLRAGEDPLLRFNLGLALATVGRDREAVEHLERVRLRLPELAAVYPVLIEAYRRLGASDREPELRAAHARALTIARIAEHARKAARFESESRLAEAARELEAALALDGRDPEIRTALGHLYTRLGRTDEAVAEYHAVLARHPNFPAAHYRLGLLAHDRGDIVAARRHLAAFLRLENRGYHVWQARKVLAALDH